jgi:hypothetical protein
MHPNQPIVIRMAQQIVCAYLSFSATILLLLPLILDRAP